MSKCFGNAFRGRYRRRDTEQGVSRTRRWIAVSGQLCNTGLITGLHGFPETYISIPFDIILEKKYIGVTAS